jgi:signal transduction histidine kinase
MLAGCFAFATAAWAAGNAESDQVSRILSDAKIQAYQLKEDASQMESFTRSTASWESHADAIDKIKEDVNAMGRLLTRLQENRNSAAAWQQTAIDRVTPVAKELASTTTAAIDRLNKNPRRLNTADYQNYLEAIADSANNLAATVTDFVDYGKARQRLERLANKLELPAGTL